MLCSFITQDLLLKNIIKRLVVLKKRRKKRMIQVTLYISFWCNLATPCEYVSFMYLQPFAKMLAVPDLGGLKNKQHKIDPNVGFYDLCPRYHIMPSKNTISKPSKYSAMRKSTCKVVKT